MAKIEKRKKVEVAAAVLIHNDLVFACQRGYGEFKDWWEFPGGIIETHAVHYAVMRFLADMRFSINAL